MDCRDCGLNGMVVPADSDNLRSLGKFNCELKDFIRTEYANFYLCPKNRHRFDPKIHGTPGWYPGRS